jgi:adenylate kinase family enzyme
MYYRRLGYLHDVDARKSVEEVKQDIQQLVSGMRGMR